jgi:hypothetical protein
MNEQFLIPLAQWKASRFGFNITNTTLVRYGKLGFIAPPPEKIRGHWCVDRNAVYIGPNGNGMKPEIFEDDDEVLRGILTHVTTSTKK